MSNQTAVNPDPVGFWHKPNLVKVLAAGYLAFPLIFWWQSRYAPAGLGEDVMSGSVFAQELFCAVSAATALLWVTRPSLFFLILLTVYFVGYKFFQFSNGVLDTPTEAAGTLFWFAAPTALLLSQARLVYTQPERRWWKRPERHAHPTGGQALCRGVKFPLVVVNGSPYGAFVRLDERVFKPEEGDGTFPSLTAAERLIAVRNIGSYPRIGDEISVAIETLPGLDSPFKHNRFVTHARVVWVTKVTDPCQHGLGLRFTRVSPLQRARLKRYFRLVPTPKS